MAKRIKITTPYDTVPLRWWQFIKRRRAQAKAHFDAAVVNEAARLVPTMFGSAIDAAMSEIPERFLRKIANLNEELRRLREERTWVPVVVRLHGFQVNRGVFSGNPMDAQVLMNTHTGELKAHPNKMIEHEGSSYRHMPEARLGAPTWKHVPDDPYAVILLGEIYRLHYGRNQPVFD